VGGAQRQQLHPPSDALDLLRRRPAEHHQELVLAQADDRLVAAHLPHEEACGELAPNVEVLDRRARRLEARDHDAHVGQRVTQQPLAECLEVRAVEAPGERVAVALGGAGRLVVAAGVRDGRRERADHPVHLERAVRAVAHRDDGLDRAHDAARAVQHDRHLARRVARHQAGERRAARLGIGHPLLECLPAQLGAVGAEQGAESWRGVEDAAVGIADVHGGMQLLHDRTQGRRVVERAVGARVGLTHLSPPDALASPHRRPGRTALVPPGAGNMSTGPVRRKPVGGPWRASPWNAS
jgi:hypothetical protein